MLHDIRVSIRLTPGLMLLNTRVSGGAEPGVVQLVCMKKKKPATNFFFHCLYH